MAAEPASGAPPRRIVVIANETCASPGMVDEVRYRAGDGAAEVVVVAPALARSRLEHWLDPDNPAAHAAAEARLAASLEALEAAGLHARGQLGDADPLQALDDAVRVYAPDEIVISTHPPRRSNWLERQVVRRARELFPLPIHHVVVDLEHEHTSVEAPVAVPAPRPDSGGAAGAAGAAGAMLRLFHASPYDEAIAIRERGFRDRSAAAEEVGVWMSEHLPAVPADGAEAVLFAIDLPEAALVRFHQGGEGGERRFLVPASLLNRHGPPVAVDDWSE